ncbi:D-alanyl-D-alanine carboxypeptidase / D-alanyl-D-alanine-endopeptidase (penicillin-binding protein 4) [Micromonospora narathiwatensis]|uniref:D-alanyl-D-alanine carboxypeptidase / D-alanyl-D-alanine-endopeptidase (Penicillin-binding protein 4) n=2 Tax=Micromonospora narathiwatensis TaxID=299146 RepID=A0A1A9A8Z7_9ACTN|nr:D-alanyl-D-alanine carboxypeptidase / D-alanyl-D-alanine-endopeptidase (penicillin-binding protein 4) [Micromonospora narathiwatensis]
MGREDSHYRPERVDGRGTGASGASGRVPIPDAQFPRVPGRPTGSASVGRADPQAYRTDPQEYGGHPHRPGSREYGADPQGYRPGPREYGGDPQGYGAGPREYGADPQGYRAGPREYGGDPVGRADPGWYGPGPAGPNPPAPVSWPAHDAPGGMPVSPPVPPVGAAPPPPPPPPRRRLRLVALLSAVLIVALAGVGLAVVRPGPVAGWLGGDGTPKASGQSPEPDPPAVLARADANAPLPAPEGVRAALEPLVRAAALGDRVNVSVADVATGQELYGRGQDDPTVPASVTKLATGVAVLAARGPAYRIPTRAVAGSAPGEVVLVGAGDPTLAVDKNGFYPGAARLDDLAAQVRKALGGTAPTKVTVDSSLFSGPVYEPGWDSDIPTGGFGAAITALTTDAARADPAGARKNFDEAHGAAERVPQPDLTAGRRFAKLLGLSGAAAEVKRGTAPADSGAAAGATAAPGTELGKVESLPMIRLVDIMISDSDNVIAEYLARQVALTKGKPASFVGGAAATDQTLGELGLPADEISLADGSGLSRTNRISPSLLTDLITLAGNGSHPELAAIFGGLPVGGWSGTLDTRYQKSATKAGAGVVRAKTGTLTGVNAIAGLVTTADGRLLTFAVLTDRTTGSLDDTREALDRISSALAGCGCR